MAGARRMGVLLAGAMLGALGMARAGWALPGISARELVELCEAGLATPGRPASRQGCVAYLDAVAATVTQIAALADENTQIPDNMVMPGPAQKPPPFCLPADEPVPRLVAVLRAYLDAHPGEEDRFAAPVVISAFRAGYGCG